jgi:hypothetical protein
MKVAHVDLDHAVGTDFRGNPKDGQILLSGADGTRDNYRLSFTRQTGPFYSPRHAHNFDQIRMVLGGGPMNYGPDCWIQPGEIAYFPEGTPYGPQDYDTARYGVTFQFGGASGSGYISLERMLEGMEELKAFGTFEKGVFHRTGDVPPGMRRERDSYEAVWEHVNGRPMEYPKPRYDEPILMKPDHFTWQDDPDQFAVSMKRLGTFSERQLEMSVLRVGAGASARIAPRHGTNIGVVLAGTGSIGAHELRLHAAFSLERDEGAVVTSTSELEVLLVGLPVFAEHERYERSSGPAASARVESPA